MLNFARFRCSVFLMFHRDPDVLLDERGTWPGSSILPLTLTNASESATSSEFSPLHVYSPLSSVEMLAIDSELSPTNRYLPSLQTQPITVVLLA